MSAKDIEIERVPLELTPGQKEQNEKYDKDRPLSSFLFVTVEYQKDNYVGRPRGYYLAASVEGRQESASGMSMRIFEVCGGGYRKLLLEEVKAYKAKKHAAWAAKGKEIEGYELLKQTALLSAKRTVLGAAAVSLDIEAAL